MIEAALLALIKVFNPLTFAYMILGVVIGITVGILPGVGPTFGLAVLIPFTFNMDPASAFALLLGAHATSYTGGALTTILLNTPGDSANAATLFDGFPMTKKGEAGRALGAALSSSATGGFLGAIFLILVIPIMRPFVLLFAPPEFFMMAVIGIGFIAIISGKSLVKGLISGGFGLMIGLIGLDMSTSTERFTFGILFLWDGIPLVPVALGLFAVAEMIELAVEGGSISGKLVSKERGGVIRGIKDTYRHWWLVLRCSAIGNIIGAIPGIGGNVACFFAYGHAKQTEKNKDQFGSGVVEGVIAPESANNAKEGGSLIPTLAFGIPGSAGMAILLGAFYIQGIATGPEMLTSNLWMVFSMAWTVAVANIFAAGICLFFANRIAKIALLPGGYLFPIVLILAGIGAYSTRNALGDLVITLLFGLIGYAMKKYNWSRPVLLIGLVLARVAEKNFLLSLQLYKDTFFQRPITIVLTIIFVATLAHHLLRQRRAGGEPPVPASSFQHVFNLAAVILVFAYTAIATGFNFKAKLMPLAVSVPILILAVWLTVSELKAHFAARDPKGGASADGGGFGENTAREAGVVAWVMSLFLALYFFGFMATSFFYVFLSLKMRSKFSLKPSLLTSSGVFLFLYAVLIKTFEVDLYSGRVVLWARKIIFGY